jgi:hypothetical protein
MEAGEDAIRGCLYNSSKRLTKPKRALRASAQSISRSLSLFFQVIEDGTNHINFRVVDHTEDLLKEVACAAE